MDYAETITTTAGPQPAWAALADVTSYPRWTASMSTVEPLDGPSLAVGGRFRIRQPGLPPTVWRVCELRPGASFAWDAHVPGVHTVAYHRVDGQPDGTTRISIGIRQTGALAWLVALLTAARTRRYLRMEAAGLKAAAESAAPASPPPAGESAAPASPSPAVEAEAVAATDDDPASTGGR
ncbi:SRPBCC family protein [Micromonospora sp. DR5-3]|uniref:SRPBCC family protein n=1 Tax=unclassified Micromonospora TaxID=2617518 RepID=UPI0011D769AD|nr:MULTISPECIES: SRPBCC family protein [unclassified Micromonospora]MCW3816697.1 SRPBCC family protein [Micromonospora sp. DR5-3]TYC22561.1 polyketide cyclase [Micromonospora sp. MP36]